VETRQLIRAIFRRALLRALLLAVACAGACASSGTPEPQAAPAVLAERCTTGPFCVAGEVDDQLASAVEGVRCVARGPNGESIAATSDKQGVFLVDGLGAPPRELRCERSGFSGQAVTVPAAAPGAAARVYVILHRIDQGECSCEPSAFFTGHDPCPPERCGGARVDTAPTAPAPDSTEAPDTAKPR
jgi:hypothetical protein